MEKGMSIPAEITATQVTPAADMVEQITLTAVGATAEIAEISKS